MVAYNKFEQFVEDLGVQAHDLNGDTLKVYAALATPSASLDAVKTDLAEISSGNGYPSGGSDVQNTYSQTSGTGTLAGTDLTWTATASAIATLRYVVMYNDTQTSPLDPLIAWWDYGSNVTPAATETFTVNFGASIFTLT